MTVAREYFERVLSPWVPGVDNPIPALVAELGSGAGLALDVGCGPGVLVCLLAQRFSRVVAIDRDPAMVEATGELVEALRFRGAQLGEVELRCADWAECDDLRGAELVCAVNSLLEPEPERRARLLEGLRRALRAEGEATLLAVFPAMEAQLRLLRLYAVALEEQGFAPGEVAAALEDEFLVAHRFDALAGTFASRGEPAQKFFYQMELGWELADAGLEVTTLAPIRYPWEVCRRVDAGYFPGACELFDWFVRARPLP